MVRAQRRRATVTTTVAVGIAAALIIAQVPTPSDAVAFGISERMRRLKVGSSVQFIKKDPPLFLPRNISITRLGPGCYHCSKWLNPVELEYFRRAQGSIEGLKKVTYPEASVMDEMLRYELGDDDPENSPLRDMYDVARERAGTEVENVTQMVCDEDDVIVDSLRAQLQNALLDPMFKRGIEHVPLTIRRFATGGVRIRGFDCAPETNNFATCFYFLDAPGRMWFPLVRAPKRPSDYAHAVKMAEQYSVRTHGSLGPRQIMPHSDAGVGDCIVLFNYWHPYVEDKHKEQTDVWKYPRMDYRSLYMHLPSPMARSIGIQHLAAPIPKRPRPDGLQSQKEMLESIVDELIIPGRKGPVPFPDDIEELVPAARLDDLYKQQAQMEEEMKQYAEMDEMNA